MTFILHRTGVVAAEPARVFAAITDISRLPTWNREIVKVVEHDGCLEVGTEWVVEISALMTRWDSRSTVVEIDAEKGVFAYRSRTDDGNPSYALWTWTLTRHREGTRVSVTAQAHPRTFWRRILAPTIRRPGLRRAMKTSLGRLDEHVRHDLDGWRERGARLASPTA